MRDDSLEKVEEVGVRKWWEKRRVVVVTLSHHAAVSETHAADMALIALSQTSAVKLVHSIIAQDG